MVFTKIIVRVKMVIMSLSVFSLYFFSSHKSILRRDQQQNDKIRVCVDSNCPYCVSNFYPLEETQPQVGRNNFIIVL